MQVKLKQLNLSEIPVLATEAFNTDSQVHNTKLLLALIMVKLHWTTAPKLDCMEHLDKHVSTLFGQ